MNSLTVREQNAVALTDSRIAELRATTETLYREIERQSGVDTLPALPSDELKAVMTARGRQLQAMLRVIATSSVDRDRAAQALGRFYGGYHNLKIDNPAMMIAAYVKKLEDFPAITIEEACDDFENHRVVDYVSDEGITVYFTLDHAPSFPRFLSVVRDKTNALRSEQAMIRRVLMVRQVRGPDLVQDPRVGVMLKELANQLATTAEVDRLSNRDEVRRQAQEARERSQRIIREAAERRATG